MRRQIIYDLMHFYDESTNVLLMNSGIIFDLEAESTNYGHHVILRANFYVSVKSTDLEICDIITDIAT